MPRSTKTMLRCDIFCDDEPTARPGRQAPVPCADRACSKPRPRDGPTLAPSRVRNSPGARSHVLAQEFPEISFADETDSGAVLLGFRRQIVFLGEPPHFRFMNIPYRKKHALENLLLHRVQEVGLILARIRAFQKLISPRTCGSNGRSPENPRPAPSPCRRKP